MRKQLLIPVLTALLVGSSTFVSCVDDKYDLSDVDMTLQIGNKEGTFTLPVSSTDTIRLNNVLDVDTTGVIKKITNNLDKQEYYFLDASGSASTATIHIEDITIPKPDINSFSVKLLQESSSSNVKAQHRTAPVAESSNIFYYNFKDLAVATIPISTSAIINSDVQDINHISFDGATIAFDVDLENFGRLKTIHYDNLQLQLPKGLEIDPEVYYVYTYKGQQKKQKGTISTSPEGHTLVTFFTGTHEGSDAGTPSTIQLTLTGAKVSQNPALSDFIFDKANNKAYIESKIQMLGYMCVKVEDLDQTTPLTAEESAKLLASGGDMSALIPLDVTYTGGGAFDKALTVTKFSGSITHKVDNIDKITLNDIPDFLNKEENVLSFANPQLILIVKSDLKTEAFTKVTLNAYRDGRPTASGVSSGKITLDGTTGQTIIKVLAKDPTLTAVRIPHEYQRNNNYILTAEKIDNIGDLYRTIPDEIEIVGEDNDHSIVVSLPACEDIDIQRDYHVDLGYRIYNELSFGPNFKIVYDDEDEDNDNSFDLGDDFDDLDINSLSIEANLVSSIPLNLSLKTIPQGKGINPTTKKKWDISNKCDISYYDANGKQFANNLLTIAPATVKDGKTTPSQQKVKIVIRNKDKNKSLKEILSSSAGDYQLDGIKYSITLENKQSGNTQGLQTQSYLILQDLQITLHGGLLFDAN